MKDVIAQLVRSNDLISLQNFILSHQHSHDTHNTLLLVVQVCIDFDNESLLTETLKFFQSYDEKIHEEVTKYCCSRGSFKCLKTLINLFDHPITSSCFKTLVTFGRKLRYVKCLRLLFEEFSLPAACNLYKDCYDVGMFEYLLSIKLEGIESLNHTVLLRFANQLLDDEEMIKYPLTVKYLKTKRKV